MDCIEYALWYYECSYDVGPKSKANLDYFRERLLELVKNKAPSRSEAQRVNTLVDGYLRMNGCPARISSDVCKLIRSHLLPDKRPRKWLFDIEPSELWPLHFLLKWELLRGDASKK